jgi:2'-5' RNA ligase
MNAVVALLDEAHTLAVEEHWAELARDFGVLEVRQRVPWPHVTFQSAERYDIDRVASTLREIAAQTAPFTARAEGLGIFSGPQPVLYVPVVRDPALNLLHARLWEALAHASDEIAPLYAPDRWMAHITLAQWDISSANLPAILARLAERPIAWQIEVSAFGLILGTGAGMEASYELRERYKLNS